MGKKKAILTTLGVIGAVAATGGLASVGIPALIGSSAAAAGGGAAGLTVGEMLALGTTGAQAAAGIYGASRQARSSTEAAQMQTDAANRAAEIQAQSTRETERFLREQAQAAWRDSEATRRGNYDQWAAMQRRIGGFSAGLGYGQHEIPGYVGSPDPGFMSGGGPGGPASGPMLPPGDPRGARAPFTPVEGSVEEYLRLRPRQRVQPAPAMGSVASYLR